MAVQLTDATGSLEGVALQGGLPAGSRPDDNVSGVPGDPLQGPARGGWAGEATEPTGTGGGGPVYTTQGAPARRGQPAGPQQYPGHGLLLEPRGAWDPGPAAAAAASSDCQSGPGPPPGGVSPRPRGDASGASGASETPGSAFRSALRSCTCLNDLEALLERQQAPSPRHQEHLRPHDVSRCSTGSSTGSSTGGSGGSSGSVGSGGRPQPPLPTADSLSVPALTALVSALPRLPEAFSASGRRMMRELLTRRLVPLVLARRGELDGAGVAIMAAALAQLGPDVLDPRDGRCDLTEALAEAGLAACSLPLEVGWGARTQRSRAPGTSSMPPGQREQQREQEKGAEGGGVALSPRQLQREQQQPEPGGGGAGWQPVPTTPPALRPPPRLYGHSPRSYSTLLYGLAKMGYRPDDFWLAGYLRASTPWLRAFPPRDLAATAWALGALGYRPGEVWLEALLEAWPTAGGSSRGGGGVGPPSRADAHSLSLLLWALWRLGVAAPGAWLDAALTQCARPAVPTTTSSSSSASAAAAVPFPGATCQSLALVSYSLARMRHSPPEAVRGVLLEAAVPLLQRGSAQDLVLLLVGVAHWPRGEGATTHRSLAGSSTSSGPPTVPAVWLQQMCLALQQCLPTCTSQSLVLSLSALAHLGYRPGAAWLQAHEAALRPMISGGGVNGKVAARVAAAWARLRHSPGRRVVGRLLRLMVAAAAGAAAAAAAGADPARLQEQRLSARVFAEGLYGIAVLVADSRGEHGGGARQRRQPHDHVAVVGAGPHAASSPRPHASSPGPHVSSSPGPHASSPGPLLAAIHLRALLAASQSRLQFGYLDEALLHLRAWQLLRVAPPHQWVANLAAVARTKLHAAPPGLLVELLRLLAWSGWRQLREPLQEAEAPQYRPPGQHHDHDQHQDQDLDQEGEYQPPLGPSGRQHRQQQVPPPGARSQGLQVSSALLGAVADRLAAALPELAAGDLADVAASLAALGARPSRSWLQLAMVAVRGRMLADGVAGVRVGLREEADAAPGEDSVAAEPVASGSNPAARLDVVPYWRALRALTRLAAAAGELDLQQQGAQLRRLLAAAPGASLGDFDAAPLELTRPSQSQLQQSPIVMNGARQQGPPAAASGAAVVRAAGAAW